MTDIPPPLHPDFGDPEQLRNMREWLTKAIQKAGATVNASGFGMGQADIDFTLEGHGFNVVITPRLIVRASTPALKTTTGHEQGGGA